MQGSGQGEARSEGRKAKGEERGARGEEREARSEGRKAKGEGRGLFEDWAAAFCEMMHLQIWHR